MTSPIPKTANAIILYTEQGVARHCKLLNTKEAWEMMGKLKIDYFAVEDADKPAVTPQVVEIEGVRGYLDKDGIVLLNAADVARELGFVQEKSDRVPTSWDKSNLFGSANYINGNYIAIRWETVNRYLAEFEFPPVDKDSFIPNSNGKSPVKFCRAFASTVSIPKSRLPKCRFSPMRNPLRKCAVLRRPNWRWCTRCC